MIVVLAVVRCSEIYSFWNNMLFKQVPYSNVNFAQSGEIPIPHFFYVDTIDHFHLISLADPAYTTQ